MHTLSNLLTSMRSRIAFAIFITAVIISGFFVSVAMATTGGPNLSITKPTAGLYIRGTYNVTWTIASTSALTGVNLLYSPSGSSYKNLVTDQTPATAASFPWATDNGSLPDGAYSVMLTDSATEQSDPVSFNIDNTPPVTTLTESATPDGSTGWYNIAHPAPSIALTCDDSSTGGSGCEEVTFAWSKSTGVMIGATTTAPGSSATITAGSIPQGDNVLMYSSQDNAVDKDGVHNIETTKIKEFKVDTTAPTISSYTVNGGSSDVYFNPSDASTTIALTASEPVTWTTVRIQSATNASVYKDLHPSNDGFATTTVTWDGSLTSSSGIAPDGAYVITYKISDEAGNVTNTEGGTLLSGAKIIVDTTAPTISGFTSPATDAIYTTSNILTFTPSDTGGTGSTPITCAYALNGGATTTVPCTSGTPITGTAVNGLTEGRNTLQLTVTDAAGNSVSEAPVSFIYDGNNTLTVSKTPSDNADFSTISAAVAASDAASLTGQTIDVYPGTYTENVTLDNAFTLQSHTGSASDVTIDGQVELKANGDTVKNLTVDNMNFNFGILIDGIDDSTVTGNTVSNIGTGSATGNVWAIYYQSPTAGGTGTVSITNNTISNIGSSANGSNGGIGVGDSTGLGTITGFTIDGNKISGITASKGAYGILVNYGANGGGSTSGLLITHNTISGLSGGWETAVGLEANTPGADIEQNTVSHVPDSAGVAFNFEQNTNAGTVTLKNNSVDNATVTYFVTNKNGGTTVDASDNYWGTAVYGTIAGKMFNAPLPGSVTFTPYYVDKAGGILSNAMVNDVYVDSAYTDGGADGGHIFGYDAFSKVQDGVSANALNDGGTVHVAAGSYSETVTVNRPLSIDGANAGVAGSDSRGAESTVQSFDVGGDNVTIDGFTLNGSGSQLTISTSSASTILSGDVIQNNVFAGYGTVGIPTENAGDLAIKNNAFNGPSGSGEPMQIKANVNGGCSGTTVSGNMFAAAGNNGGADINFSCTGSASSNVIVSGNTDAGNSGGTSFAAFAGVANNLLVTDNTATTNGSTLYFWGGMTGSTTISGNKLTGGSASSGISVHDSLDGANTGGFTITDNTIDGSGYGIYVASGALTGGAMNATGNEISGNTQYGIDNNDSNVTINAEKNWWGDKTGPFNAVKNPSGLANKVSDYVDFSPFCLESGCSSFGSVDPIASLSLAASPSSVPTTGTSTLTATALDANGYTVVNDNNATQIQFSADSGASLGALYVNLGTDGAAQTTVNNTSTGVTNVAAEVVGSSPVISASTKVTFTPADTTPPSVTSVSPSGAATNVSISIVPQIDVSEALAQATVDSANVYLKTSTTTVPATVALVEGGTRVTITPDSTLAYDTQYTIVVSTGVTDLSGNALTAEYDSTFTTESAPVSTTPPTITSVQVSNVTTIGATITWTTDQNSTSQVEYGSSSSYGSYSALNPALSMSHSVTLSGLSANATYHFRVASVDALGNAASSTDNVFATLVDNSSALLAVTGIDALSSYATPDNTFGDGWSWIFHLTLPTGQNNLALKFSDFTSGTNVIPAASNIEYYSPQSSLHDSTSTAVLINGADAYPSSILLDGSDLDPSTPGQQIEVMVDMKVPTTAAGGSYSASYGVTASSTAF